MAVSTSLFSDAGATVALIKAYLGTDEHTNFEPVHDDAEDIDATDFNRIVAGLAECGARLRPGNIVAIPFELTSLSASTTAQAILGGSSDKTVQQLFKDGTLIGITAKHSAAISAGNLTVQPQIATVNTALSLGLSSSAQQGRAHQLVSDADAADIVDAGDDDEIEVDITTDGSFAPTGNDVHGYIWFSIGEEEGI